MRPLSTDASSQASGPITPASERFNPFDPDFVRDPYPTLNNIRRIWNRDNEP